MVCCWPSSMGLQFMFHRCLLEQRHMRVAYESHARHMRVSSLVYQQGTQWPIYFMGLEFLTRRCLLGQRQLHVAYESHTRRMHITCASAPW